MNVVVLYSFFSVKVHSNRLKVVVIPVTEIMRWKLDFQSRFIILCVTGYFQYILVCIFPEHRADHQRDEVQL